jgi:hypothetical protein
MLCLYSRGWPVLNLIQESRSYGFKGEMLKQVQHDKISGFPIGVGNDRTKRQNFVLREAYGSAILLC